MKKTRRIATRLSAVFLMVVCVMTVIIATPITSSAILADEDMLCYGFSISGLSTPKIDEEIDKDVSINISGATVNRVRWYQYNLENPEYYGEMLSSDIFTRGMGYRVTIDVSANDGYVFGSYLYLYVNGSSVNTYELAKDRKSVKITVDYGELCTYINYINASFLEAPTYNQPLDTALVTGDGFNVVSQGWYNENGVKYSDGAIVSSLGNYYEYRLVVKSKFGYKFNSKGSFNSYINGYSVNDYTLSEDRETLTITKVFAVQRAEVQKFDVEVTAPISGARPNYTASSNTINVDSSYNDSSFTNGVAWYEKTTGRKLASDETFVEGKIYTVKVKVICGEQYEFKAGTSNANYTINGQASTYTYFESQPRVIFIETDFRVPETIGRVALNGEIKPVAGEKPNYNVTASTSGVEVTNVFWYKINGSSSEQINSSYTFQLGEHYQILVKYRVTGDKTLDYNEARDKLGYIVTCGDYTFTINKYATDNDATEGTAYLALSCDNEIIGQVDISIDPPTPGSKPNFSATAASSSYYPADGIYSGTINGVVWYDITSGFEALGENDSFIPNHTYRLIVYLQAKSGNSFAYIQNVGNVVIGSINGIEAEASMVTEAHNTMCVFIDFTCPKEELHRLDLTISVPVVGEKPDYSGISTDKVISNPQYTSSTPGAENGVVWHESDEYGLALGKDDLIRPNTKIEFLTALNPTDSYTFADDLVVYINGKPVDYFFLIGDSLVVGIELTPKTCDACILELVRGTAPTCTEEGTEHSYRCTKCGQNYKDNKGEEPIYKGDEWGSVPALGHRYGNAVEHLAFDDGHLATCLECGAEGRVDCTIIEREIPGPSQYSRLDAVVSSCSECKRVYSVYVEEWACDHEMGDWTPIKSLGEHTGVHFRSCPCGLNRIEDECSNRIVFVKGPYNGIERDVMLYICEHCDGEITVPADLGQEGYLENYTDVESNLVFDFSHSDMIIHPNVTINVAIGNEQALPDGLQEDIYYKFGDNTSYYAWYNVMVTYDYMDMTYPVVPAGKYTITMDAPIEIQEHKTVRVCIVSDEFKLLKVVEIERNENTITFETDRFGHIVVVGDEDPMYILTYQLKGGGQGTQVGDMFYPGDSFDLEDCTLIPDEGFRFKCWEIDGVEYNPGDTIIVNKDTYVYTVWERIPEEVHQHSYVDGVCECGAWDPDYEPEAPVNPDPKPDDPTDPDDPKPDDPKPDDPTDPDGNEPEEKDHSECKANGWVRFWTAIGNFFRMIFGMPKLCVCGEELN